MLAGGRYTASSWPRSSAARRSSSSTVGSSRFCSSPTSALAMAERISWEGCVAVSERRSIIGENLATRRCVNGLLHFGMTDARCALRLSRRYDAAPAEVWTAMSDLDRWLAPPDGVTVRDSETERRLERDWRPEGEPPSEVVVELRAEGAYTVVVIEHTQIDATRGMSYIAAWGRALERVEAAR